MGSHEVFSLTRKLGERSFNDVRGQYESHTNVFHRHPYGVRNQIEWVSTSFAQSSLGDLGSLIVGFQSFLDDQHCARFRKARLLANYLKTLSQLIRERRPASFRNNENGLGRHEFLDLLRAREAYNWLPGIVNQRGRIQTVRCQLRP